MSLEDKRKRYGDDSIDSMTEVEFTRLRPQSALGSDTIEGAKHGAGEIIANSLDEAGQGFGHKIEIRQHEDGSVSVRDYGRGVPVGWNEKHSEWNWNLVFNKLHAGGKYGKSGKNFDDLEDLSLFREEDYDNLDTVGLYGVGASATQFTSAFFEVTSIRDGKKSRMRFENGYPALDAMVVEDTDEPSGTLIHWLPDAEVFNGEYEIPGTWLKSQASVIAITSGIDVTYTDKFNEVTEYAASSIDQSLTELLTTVGSNETTFLNRDRGKNQFAKAHVVFGPAKSGVAQMKFFQNRIEVRNGDHARAVSNALTNFFHDSVTDLGVKINYADTVGMITVWAWCRANRVNWDSLTKDRVEDSHHIYRAIHDATLEGLKKEWARGSQWLVDVVDTVKQAALLRVEQENLRKQVREVNKAIKKRGTLPEKFVGSRNYMKKQYSQSELWIAEGDSAKGQLDQARDQTYQSTFPIRGKSLNVFKAKLERILGNAEIQNLVQIMGAGVDLGELHDELETFDIKNLRFSKIIIASDADKDGYHIRTLMVTMFWRLFPDIIKNGMLYIAESPIYRHIPTNQYFYTEEEFNEFAQGRSFPEDDLKRYKGLGALEPGELRETTMLEGQRRLVQIQFDPNDTEVYDVFQAIYGSDTSNRKRVILNELLVGDTDYETIEGELNDMDKFIDDEDLEDERDYQTVTF